MERGGGSGKGLLYQAVLLLLAPFIGQNKLQL